MTNVRQSPTANGRIVQLQQQVTALQAAVGQLLGASSADFLTLPVTATLPLPGIATTPTVQTGTMTSGVGLVPSPDADVFLWVPVNSTGSAGFVVVGIAPDGVTYEDMASIGVPAGMAVPVSLYLRAGMGIRLTCTNCVPEFPWWY